MKKINKKGQAAIEFLVTYGWAIMAAMVVIGALTYFGMTNPSTSLPDKCIFSNAFECKDFLMTEDTVRLQMVNTFGQTIYAPIGAACTNDDVTCVCTTVPANPAFLDPDGTIEIICTDPPDSPFNIKEKAKVKVSITYYKSASGGYRQVSLGEVYATVQ
jgi:uncharacterized protein (UPF0333 family)